MAREQRSNAPTLTSSFRSRLFLIADFRDSKKEDPFSTENDPVRRNMLVTSRPVAKAQTVKALATVYYQIGPSSLGRLFCIV
jgi:hypothetical protein